MKGFTLPLPKEYPKVGEVYKHYKGDNYEVVGLALHSNDDIWMVVYKPLYEHADAQMFTRPLDEWSEIVSHDGEVLRRFTLI